MKFNIFDRFVLDIIRQDGRWTAFRIGQGTRVPVDDLVIPADMDVSGLITFLEDMFHELARPEKEIRKLD